MPLTWGSDWTANSIICGMAGGMLGGSRGWILPRPPVLSHTVARGLFQFSSNLRGSSTAPVSAMTPPLAFEATMSIMLLKNLLENRWGSIMSRTSPYQ